MADRQPARIVRVDSDAGCWELAIGAPDASLRAYVREYVGGSDRVATPIWRRELPTDIVPLIVNFGAPFRLIDPRTSGSWIELESFAAGPSDSYVLVGSTGPSAVLQINFTILGARLFFDRPLGELARRAVDIEDIFGAAGRRLTLRLQEAPTWDARFAVADREIAARIAAARAPSGQLLWAWRRITASHGQIGVRTLVSEVGCSHKHLISRFKEEIGLPPKTLARVLRFGRAVAMLRQTRVQLADVALACGYYDQAHFSRDFREFAGVPPTELISSVMPDGGFSAKS